MTAPLSQLPRAALQLKSLLQEHSPLRLVLEKMQDGILLCDGSGRVLFCNDTLKHWLGLEQASNQLCYELIPDETLWEVVKSTIETGQADKRELTIGLGNQERIFQVHLIPLVTGSSEEEHRTNGCVVTFHDVTAIRKTEKMRRDFVANVSHELRTPLSAIKGYSETLLDGALEDQEVGRDFVEIIYKHSLRLSQLVEDLLDLSKLESPDYKADLESLALEPILAHVWAMAQDCIAAKRLTLKIDVAENLSETLGNIGHLEQVLTNLLDNAIKYTPEGGYITIAAFEKNESDVQIDIRDTGIGIDAKHIHRVFERFYRVDKARSREMGGTGLGLSIVKHIIQLHGGDIWVESTPQQGSTFSFTLKKAR